MASHELPGAIGDADDEKLVAEGKQATANISKSVQQSKQMRTDVVVGEHDKLDGEGKQATASIEKSVQQSTQMRADAAVDEGAAKSAMKADAFSKVKGSEQRFSQNKSIRQGAHDTQHMRAQLGRLLQHAQKMEWVFNQLSNWYSKAHLALHVSLGFVGGIVAMAHSFISSHGSEHAKKWLNTVVVSCMSLQSLLIGVNAYLDLGKHQGEAFQTGKHYTLAISDLQKSVAHPSLTHEELDSAIQKAHADFKRILQSMTKPPPNWIMKAADKVFAHNPMSSSGKGFVDGGARDFANSELADPGSAALHHASIAEAEQNVVTHKSLITPGSADLHHTSIAGAEQNAIEHKSLVTPVHPEDEDV